VAACDLTPHELFDGVLHRQRIRERRQFHGRRIRLQRFRRGSGGERSHSCRPRLRGGLRNSDFGAEPRDHPRQQRADRYQDQQLLHRRAEINAGRRSEQLIKVAQAPLDKCSSGAYLTYRLLNVMVQYDTASDPLSSVFAALADPTRRAILDRLTSGEASVSELSEPFDMSMPAISKHLKVLERAGLIARSRDAQWRPCHLDPAPLTPAA